MEINVFSVSMVGRNEYKKGVQDVTEYHAHQLINAGVAVSMEKPEIKKEEVKKEEVKPTKKVNRRK